MDPTSPEGPWPGVNSHLEISGPWWPDWLPSRVEGRDGHELVIAAPTTPRDGLLLAQPGDSLRLQWTLADRGLGTTEGTVVASRLNPLPVWRVQCVEPELHQRREYARLPITLTVILGSGERGQELSSIDLSEGGMRCLTPASMRLNLGDLIEAEVDFEGPPIRIVAEVVRIIETGELGMLDIGLRFLDLPERDGERIRKFIFQQQARQRAMERS
jgi:hypothetical protein